MKLQVSLWIRCFARFLLLGGFLLMFGPDSLTMAAPASVSNHGANAAVASSIYPGLMTSRFPAFQISLSALSLFPPVQTNGRSHSTMSPAAGACNPKVSHMEITQAIQHSNPVGVDVTLEQKPPGIQGPPEANLVDGRATTARVYVDCPDCICNTGELGGIFDVVDVQTGQSLVQGSVFHVKPFADNSGRAKAHPPVWHRDDIDDTL